MPTLEGLIDGIVDAHVNLYDAHGDSWAVRKAGRLSAPVLRRMPGPAVRLASRYTIDPSLYGVVGRDVIEKRYELRDYVHDLAGLDEVAGVPVVSVLPVDSQWRHRSASEDVAAEQFREYAYLASLPYGGIYPELGGLVVAGDTRVPGLGVQRILEAETAGRLRGVRVRVGRHPDPLVHDFTVDAAGLQSSNLNEAVEQLIERDLLLEVLCYSHQLGDVHALAGRFPELTIVLTRLGFPAGAFGPVGSSTGSTAAARADILGLWRERMAMLATRPNVVVKADAVANNALGYGEERSGNIGGRAILADMIGPLLLYVGDRFGPDRIMFGSNSPLDRHNVTVATMVGALIDVLSERGDHWLKSFFADNARRVYRTAP
ncbi:MAG: amidohydrolase family protein [Gordonia sp. (in: high G+C Gram-positive bacteria)]|uniref:amidohydrolase family protein n=1 Tax=Gordonia sp. (in: high G+C Gram-positive bacteria) TaxID=84139 RepID=UPI0039E658C2